MVLVNSRASQKRRSGTLGSLERPFSFAGCVCSKEQRMEGVQLLESSVR